MSSHTCPACGHQWNETVVVPDWYEILVSREGAEIPVPSYEHCAAWLDEHDGAWALAEEMATVVIDYWDPKRKKSPWGMFQRYVLKELRMKAERQEQKKKNY